ncbi:MAG TPA: DUF6174 domain-containing protein [Nocardioides sp.]|nr:DUF6174 domain-containing protein [Nocardioides sp.]
MGTRPTRPNPRPVVAVLAISAALLASMTACGHENDETARDDSTPAASSPSTGSTTDSAGTGGSYPDFAPQDYTFRLEVLCFCPQVGAVRVEVHDGRVVSATTLGGGRGVQKGAKAPDYARKTINDVIAVANDTTASSVKVTWPDGQDYPSSVAVDRMANATDDEVTYIVKNVRLVSAG